MVNNDAEKLIKCLSNALYYWDYFRFERDEDDIVVGDKLEGVGPFTMRVAGKIGYSHVVSYTSRKDFISYEDEYSESGIFMHDIVAGMHYGACVVSLYDPGNTQVEFDCDNGEDRDEKQRKIMGFIGDFLLHCKSCNDDELIIDFGKTINGEYDEELIPIIDRQTGIIYNSEFPLGEEIPEGSDVIVTVRIDDARHVRYRNFDILQIDVISSPEKLKSKDEVRKNICNINDAISEALENNINELIYVGLMSDKYDDDNTVKFDEDEKIKFPQIYLKAEAYYNKEYGISGLFTDYENSSEYKDIMGSFKLANIYRFLIDFWKLDENVTVKFKEQYFVEKMQILERLTKNVMKKYCDLCDTANCKYCEDNKKGDCQYCIGSNNLKNFAELVDKMKKIRIAASENALDNSVVSDSERAKIRSLIDVRNAIVHKDRIPNWDRDVAIKQVDDLFYGFLYKLKILNREIEDKIKSNKCFNPDNI